MNTTIVIPCNEKYEEWLPEAYASAIAQTIPVKVIIVGYGLKGSYPEATVLKIEKPFEVAESRNIGIKEVDTPFVFCLDADDSIDPTYIEKAEKLADEKTCVTAWMSKWGGATEFTLNDFLTRNRCNTETLFPKQAWIDVGGFDPNCVPFEDWEFWIHVVSKGYKFQLIREPLINYRLSDSSITNTLRYRRTAVMDYMFAKHRNLYEKINANS